MEWVNSADPPPVLLSHGRPNPHHTWARMWIALPFTQQPVSVLSMAFNWLRIIFSACIQIKPPRGTKASPSLLSGLWKRTFLPEKIQHYWHTLGGARMEFFFLLTCLFVSLIYMSSSRTLCSCDYNNYERNICMCFNSHKGSLLYDHLSKTTLSCRFFLFLYYFKASLTLSIATLLCLSLWIFYH